MSNLSNMPWEDRPVGSKEVVWRYSANPIIPRDLLPTSNSIFNSAVVPFGDSYAGVFRCDDTNRRMRDRKSTRLNSSHVVSSRMPSSA